MVMCVSYSYRSQFGEEELAKQMHWYANNRIALNVNLSEMQSP
jgi:hypothetical protein